MDTAQQDPIVAIAETELAEHIAELAAGTGRYIGRDEAAKLIGFTPYTWDRKVREAGVTKVYYGRHVRYPRAEALALIARMLPHHSRQSA